MARPSKKQQTTELLTQFFHNGKPEGIRNQILLLNKNLIGWVTKHYQTDGYALFDDLFQEAMLESIIFVDTKLKKQDIPWFSIRLCTYLKEKLKKYRYELMSSMSEEVNNMFKTSRAFKEYMRENNDLWTAHTLDWWVGRKYEELYGDLYIKPTYQQERISPDEIEVAPIEVEVATIREVVDCIYDLCEIKDIQRMAIDAYLFHEYDLDIHGTGKTTCEMIFSKLAWKRGVTVSAIYSNFINGIKNIRENMDTHLMSKRMLYTDNIIDLCNNRLKLSYFNNDDEQEYFGDLDDEAYHAHC